LTAAQLAFLFSAVTAHELGHNMMGWWGKGLVDCPRNEPVGFEVGDFIEEKILGGVCMAVWEKTHVGDFKRALSMGIEVNGNFFEIGLSNFKIFMFISLTSSLQMMPLPVKSLNSRYP
jgi:hypothetical protein